MRLTMPGTRRRNALSQYAGLTLSGQWSLPANADQNWIVIRTSQHAQLPEGKRVVPADASKLFKIQNTSVDATLIAAAAANHIRIIGAEITIDPSALGDAPGGATQSGLIALSTNLANNASNIPKFIGFDRCYVHGLPTKNTGRGLLATWEDSFVIDSYFDEFHFTGFDGQAILFLDAKRNKILNNTFQIWATSWASWLVNFNSGRDGNYRVASGTTWKNAASDGRDLGAHVDGVEGATANAPSGNWPSP
jgi:hypothetical protein